MGALLELKPVNVITLTLLHPNQSIPVRVWTFEQEEVIRIGRSVKNDVVLYSAVVSRYHVELRLRGKTWTIVGLGTNGTYLDGKLVQESPIADGQIIHLAISGPKIKLNIPADKSQHLMSRIGVRERQIKTADHLDTGVKVDHISSSTSSQLISSEPQEDITVTE
ncbi:FHA domain-containing protein [Capilliphycus salinus ALCB114379]|uniref:FHA domain-containing protein n=1 Tax=Capilliphycus salinus TaxID=2768948 RepID=UPI0039A6DF66